MSILTAKSGGTFCMLIKKVGGNCHGLEMLGTIVRQI